MPASMDEAKALNGVLHVFLIAWWLVDWRDWAADPSIAPVSLMW